MTASSISSSGNAPKPDGPTLTYCLKRRRFLNAGCPAPGGSSPAVTSLTCSKCPQLYTLRGTSQSISPKTLKCLQALAAGAGLPRFSSKIRPPELACYQLGLYGTGNPTI